MKGTLMSRFSIMEKEISKIIKNMQSGKLTDNCRQYRDGLADSILEKIRSLPDEDYDIEFKEGRIDKQIGKAISSLSNKNGGVIFLGIRDSDHKIIGLSEDLKEISESINDHLIAKCYPDININFIYFYPLKHEIVYCFIVKKLSYFLS